MDNVMHIIKVAVPILFALIVLILLWTLFKAARKKIGRASCRERV